MSVADIGAGYGGYALRRVCDFSAQRLNTLQELCPDIRTRNKDLVVVGERGMAVFDDARQSDKLQLYDKKIELIVGRFVVEKPKPQPIAFSSDEPLLLGGRHCLDCMQTRLPPKTGGADAWRVLKVIEAGRRSLSMNGEPVQLQAQRSLEVVHA